MDAGVMSASRHADPLAPQASSEVGSTQRTVGVVLMGVGAAGLVVGTIFGVDALQKNNDAKDVCGDDTSCPTQEGENLSDDAQQAALVSTIGFVAGGLALAGGAVVYLTAPDGTEAGQLKLSPIAGGAQFSFAGRF